MNKLIIVIIFGLLIAISALDQEAQKKVYTAPAERVNTPTPTKAQTAQRQVKNVVTPFALKTPTPSPNEQTTLQATSQAYMHTGGAITTDPTATPVPQSTSLVTTEIQQNPKPTIETHETPMPTPTISGACERNCKVVGEDNVLTSQYNHECPGGQVALYQGGEFDGCETPAGSQ